MKDVNCVVCGKDFNSNTQGDYFVDMGWVCSDTCFQQLKEALEYEAGIKNRGNDMKSIFLSRGWVIINARRWFYKECGNMYHSVSVFVNGDFIGQVPFMSGDEDQYIKTAFSILQHAGFYPNTNNAYCLFTEDMRKYRGSFYISVSDVPTKHRLLQK